MNNYRQKSDLFHSLHYSDKILLVPNAWDVLSAKFFEVEGFKCVATTSAGMANVMGKPDVENMKLEENLEVVKRITEKLQVPVSADVEAGYTNNLNTLYKNIKKIIDAGAVGINLEDSPGTEGKSLMDIAFQCEKIKTIRESSEEYGCNLFINARIDAWMFLEGDKSKKIDLCLQRAENYIKAGADSIFVPDLEDMDEETISELVNNIDAPLNLIAGKNTPPVNRLEQLGVKRLSFGPRPLRALLGKLKNITDEIKSEGTYSEMNNKSYSYSELNNWFK